MQINRDCEIEQRLLREDTLLHAYTSFFICDAVRYIQD